jgi:glyoxylase-like metal-dependent hydrolase (beta-lactamase superfamily II)
MSIKSIKLLTDGFFELDMGMLVYAKTPYYGVKYMAALKPLLIQTDSDYILVDSGMGTLPEKYRPYYKVTRKPDQTLKNSLETEGLSADDISIVINTHLHVDHCGNNKLFKNAKFVVQNAELDYAFNPHRFQKGGYIKELFEGLNYHTVSGNSEILPGIDVVLTSGHTPGHQCVIVDAKETKLGNKYVYCGDEAPLEENLKKRNITGILYNQVKSLEALDMLLGLNAKYIYSHERTQLQI